MNELSFYLVLMWKKRCLKPTLVISNNNEEEEEEEEGGDDSWVWLVHSCNPQYLGGLGRKITANFLLY